VHLDLPGRPDIVFPSERLAVFVHGCYWHRCPTCALPEPKANAAFWREKFAVNLARDRRVESALRAAGWHVETVWEHEVRRSPEAAADRLLRRRLELRRWGAQRQTPERPSETPTVPVD
jgi:DNA mismatch endonuclease, patch repair protein